MEQFDINVIQQELQKAIELSKVISPEDKPYEDKYQARKILENILIQVNEHTNYKAVVLYFLGLNFHETEETSKAFTYFQDSLDNFNKIDDKFYYSSYLQTIYNNLGYLNLNRDQDQQGMELLGKAETLGQYLLTQIQEQKIDNLNKKPLEGDLTIDSVNAAYTITLFYLAQAYTKSGQKEKGAKYCGETMKRQLESKKYELKDWCVNCISMSDYYLNNNNFSQALYFLQSGESIIPEGQKKKLRATISMSMGKLLHELLTYCVTKIINNQQFDAAVEQEINSIKLEFEGISIKPIKLKPCQNYEEIKNIFKQSNTCYKKALQRFPLDGYVTEYLQIQLDISQMYKHLAYLETDISKILAILGKRRELLEPIMNQINPKAFKANYEQILTEVAEIYNQEFELIFQHEFLDDKPKAKINKKNISLMNSAAKKLIQHYKQIEIILLNDIEESQKDTQYYKSVVNAKFNQAKALSKFWPDSQSERVEALVQSLKLYKGIQEYIEKEIWKKDSEKEKFKEEYKMSLEMLSLLPAKIDRVNSGK